MFRKTILGLAAGAALVTAALAPTAASAHYYGYGYKSYHAPSYSYSYKCYDCGYRSYGYKSYGYGYRSYGY